MKRTISLVLVAILVLMVEFAQADYTFGTPENLGPPINTEAGEGSVAISADGLELYFSGVGEGGMAELWVAKRPTTSDPWGQPVNLGPTVNSPEWDSEPSISADGLSLYFDSNRSGGQGEQDIYITTRPSKNDPWGTPVNLGAPVNSTVWDAEPYVTADDLGLYFISYRPGGYGESDIYMATRPTKDDPWDEPVNLGPIVNTSGYEGTPYLSPDGLKLFLYGFSRGGAIGPVDIWVATRPTQNDEWADCVVLGPEVNSPAVDTNPCLSPDGSVLYFQSLRSGGLGEFDLWQVSIDPVVDLNGDGIVDSADMCIMIGYWGTDESLCDIGPMPWGDGIVDVEDLIVLAEHLFEEFPPVESVE